MTGVLPQSAGQVLGSGVVRVTGQDGRTCGTGVLVAPDLVLTCAHVVSDCLGVSPVGLGSRIMVDFPLAERNAHDLGPWVAEVERCVPIRSDRTGDVALLRMRSAVSGTHPLPLAVPEDVWGHQARAVGFTGGEPTALWFRGVLGGATAEGWVQLSRADGQTEHVREGYSGGPVWDDALGAVIGVVVAAQPERDAQQVFVLRTQTLLRELPELEDILLPVSPYRGLATLGEADADVFFGRDDDVDRVAEKLRGDPFVTVCGPSGCGKSSLVLAGVVPRMREEDHEVLVLNAGRLTSPRAALATELFELVASGDYGEERARLIPPESIERWLDELGFTDTFHRVTGCREKNVVVVIDQAEALLDIADPEIEQAVKVLFPERRADGLQVLLTLRADFLEAALLHPRLGPALQRGTTITIAPMTREQLGMVITAPLELVPGVEYDPGLDQRILKDVGEGAGALPLLGFLLAKLWDRRVGGRLRTEAYAELGEVTGALKRHAEKAWRACVEPGEEFEARLLLTRLVRFLPGSEVPLRRVLTRQEIGERHWDLARAFARPKWRLLVMRGGEGRPQSVELSHEALITAWPMLKEQVDRNTDFLVGCAEVRHDLERWREAGRPKDLLPGSHRLMSLETRLGEQEADLTGEEREFLARARRHRGRRRTALWTSGVAGVLALILIAGLTGFLIQESKMRAKREAEGLSRSLAIQSDDLVETNPVQASLVALAAYETAPTEEARSALMRRYLDFQHTEWALSGVEGEIMEADMSADGTVTLARSKGGRATLFVRTDEGEVRQEQLGLDENVLSPVVSRDGRRIAYVHEEGGTVVWHEVRSGEQRLLGPPHRLEGAFEEYSAGVTTGGMEVMDFSPDAALLVGVSAVSSDLPIQVWDLEKGLPQELPEDTPRLTEVWFGPEEHTLVGVASEPEIDPEEASTATLVTIDVETGEVRELAEDISSRSVSVSKNGDTALVCREEGTDPDAPEMADVHYQAVRVPNGRVMGETLVEERGACSDTLLSEDGERFAMSENLGEKWKLVDFSGDRTETTSFLGPSYPVFMGSGHLPLLGTAEEPILLTQGPNAIIGWRLLEHQGNVTSSPPQLLDDGSTLVARVGPEAETLSVVESEEGHERNLATVDRDISVPPVEGQELKVDRSGTLVADVSDGDRITVYDLPSLHTVSEFSTISPPPDEYLRFQFLGEDRLITYSGPNLEQWDVHTGRRLSHLDLDGLGLTEQEEPSYSVSRHHEPGHVLVNVDGEPDLRVVDLVTGEEKKEFGFRIEDAVAVIFLDDPNYVAVMTTGRMVELWSVFPGEAPERTVGPLGPLLPGRWSGTVPGGAGFFLANDRSAQLLWADDPVRREIFQFEESQGFPAVSQDGRTVMRTPFEGGHSTLLRLDPKLWKRHLCAITGRGFTTDEVSGLPANLPGKVCSRGV